MDINELKRTFYRDASDPVINHETRDHREDIDHYHMPKMRMHNANLHGWGIASGLQVRKNGASQLVIEQGLAIAKKGRMIPLAESGKSYINDVTVPGNLVDVPVVFDTIGFDDTYYLTIELPNTIITDPLGQPLSVEGRVVTEGTSERILNTPLVTLQQVADFSLDDSNPMYGTAIVLAKVGIVGGLVDTLSADDRQLTAIEVGKVVFKQGAETEKNAAPDTVIGTIPSAIIRSLLPAEGSGWNGVGVSSNMILFEDYSGNKVVKLDAMNSILEIGETGKGGNLILKDGDGRTVMKLYSELGLLDLGEAGQRGKLTIKDSAGREALYFDANNAVLVLGAPPLADGTPGQDGDLVIKDYKGRITAQIDGQDAALYLGASPSADGTPGQDGDLIIKDYKGRVAAQIDGHNAALYLGASPLADGTPGQDGDLKIKDYKGRVAAQIDGNSASLSLGASPLANGTPGKNGDLKIKDYKGRVAAQIDGNNAALYLGASPLADGTPGQDGDLRIKNYSGEETVKIDGASGRIISNGRVIAGNPTRYVEWRHFNVEGGELITLDITLPHETQVCAYPVILGSDRWAKENQFDNRIDLHDMYHADITHVNDVRLPTYGTLGNSYLGFHSVRSPCYVGRAQKVTFRAYASSATKLFGMFMMFYE